MSSTTPNLSLFKYDTANDGTKTFSITSALNDNWDTLDGKWPYIVKRSSTTSYGSSTTPVYVNSSANIVNCSYSIGPTRFDGQWVAKTETLSTATAVGTYTIDLSSYLPNDNYNYEVKIMYIGYRASGNENSQVTISSSAITSVVEMNNISSSIFAFASFDGNHAECGNFTTAIKIETSRQFYFNIRNATIGSNALCAIAYRRIGTNT